MNNSNSLKNIDYHTSDCSSLSYALLFYPVVIYIDIHHEQSKNVDGNISYLLPSFYADVIRNIFTWKLSQNEHHILSVLNQSKRRYYILPKLTGLTGFMEQ